MNQFEKTIGVSACIALLYFGLTFSFHVFAGIIDQPHPTYYASHWLIQRMERSFYSASLFAILMFICVPIDLQYQYVKEPDFKGDFSFFPRFNKIWEWKRNPIARWLIILTVLYLTYYLAGSFIQEWTMNQFAGGIIWPPERVYLTCLILWGTLWIADCLCRPARGTITAALFFTLFSYFIAATYNGFLRE